MAYFVLLWNRDSDKTSLDAMQELGDRPSHGSWSCGNAKGITVGDIVILRRTGRGPKGIVGIGTVTRGSYEAPWSTTGELGLFVDVDWQHTSEEPIIYRDDPEVSGLDRLWTAQAGGSRIGDDDGKLIGAKIEQRYEASLPTTVDQSVARFEEGKRMQRTVAIRGRNASVRDHCLQAHPPVCAVCGFDPIGMLGSGFEAILEVHHLDPIAESDSGRTTDPIEDCRPLCPTCHRLAHHSMQAGTCRSIDELKVLVGRFSCARRE